MARNQPKLKLDPTPSFEEEVRDFEDESRYLGSAPFDQEDAKRRIDRIAHRLARIWSVFLIYIILAQGLQTGLSLPVPYFNVTVPLIPTFKLGSAEFVAVVTTTTVTVFGFLVIVARFLFHTGRAKRSKG